MAGIEAFLSLTVAALHLAVVPWCVRSDQLMPDAQLRGSFLKQCRQVTPAIGETVGEFKPIVSLNALYLYSSAGVPRPQLAQEIRRRIGGLLRISCQEFIDGGVLEQAQLRIRDSRKLSVVEVTLQNNALAHTRSRLKTPKRHSTEIRRPLCVIFY